MNADRYDNYPNYGPSIIDFEQNFNNDGSYQVLLIQIFKYLFIPCGLYVLIVFFGQKLMENREPFKLHQQLFYWNLTLAVLSMFGFKRFLHEILWVIKHYGVDGTICLQMPHTGPHKLWQFMICLLKLVEFGDTIFLILRKKPVMFLHWYHHATVAYLTFQLAIDHRPISRWFAGVNYGIHGVMYTYYALSGKGYRFPKLVSMAITSLQILQMFFGLFITVNWFIRCHDQKYESSAYSALFIYATYVILFGKFFILTYCSQKKKVV